MPPLLLAELQRRRVFRATVAYGVAAFAMLQIAEPVMHALHWPESVLTWIVLALTAGFPLTVALAWIFDLRAGRIERTPGAGGPAGPRLAVMLTGIGVLAAAPGLVWYFGLRNPPRATPVAASIAVLPFVDMSAQKDQEYFSDGLAEELLNLMAKVPGLHVAARTSSFAFKGRNEDVAAIAGKLHVATVLEGSVRKAGDRIRITTQLIDARDGYHLWSETYDRQLTDLFGVQDEIARAVVAALKLELLKQPVPTAPRTASTEAYNEYLLGKEFFHRNNVDGFRRAEKAYQRAVELDPEYAPSWAGLAVASYWVADSADSLPALVAGQDRALAAAERAIALAPDQAEGYAARAFLLVSIRQDFPRARPDWDRALSLAPENAEILADYVTATLRPLGKLQEGIALLRKAVDRDPLNARTWSALGTLQAVAAKPGGFGPAREAFQRSLEISPDQSYTPMHYAATYLFDGNPAEALAVSQRSSNAVFRLQGAALAHHALGHEVEAQKALDELTTRFAFSAAYQIAAVRAFWGDKDGAFTWLGRAVEQRDGGVAFAKVDPLLAKLHGDPRYVALLGKLNLPVD